MLMACIDLECFEEIIPQVDDGAPVEGFVPLEDNVRGSQGARPKFVAPLNEGMRSLRDHRIEMSPSW